MRLNTDMKIPGMAGMGPAAWDRDNQKMSMHSPLPEHVDYVEEQLHRHDHDHHIVHRRHPENDCDETLVPMEIPVEECMQIHHHEHHLKHHNPTDKEAPHSEDKDAEPVMKKKHHMLHHNQRRHDESGFPASDADCASES